MYLTNFTLLWLPLSVCAHICLSVHLAAICLELCAYVAAVSLYPLVHLPACLYIFVSVCPFICLSLSILYLSVYLSIWLYLFSVCLFNYLSICLKKMMLNKENHPLLSLSLCQSLNLFLCLPTCWMHLPILILISDGTGLGVPEWLNNRFCGFRSLWTIPLDCKAHMAEAARNKLHVTAW